MTYTFASALTTGFVDTNVYGGFMSASMITIGMMQDTAKYTRQFADHVEVRYHVNKNVK